MASRSRGAFRKVFFVSFVFSVLNVRPWSEKGKHRGEGLADHFREGHYHR